MIFFIQLTDAMHYGEKQRCQRGEEGWMEGLALSLSLSVKTYKVPGCDAMR
jgi:hypothetical protein